MPRITWRRGRFSASVDLPGELTPLRIAHVAFERAIDEDTADVIWHSAGISWQHLMFGLWAAEMIELWGCEGDIDAEPAPIEADVAERRMDFYDWAELNNECLVHNHIYDHPRRVWYGLRIRATPDAPRAALPAAGDVRYPRVITLLREMWIAEGRRKLSADEAFAIAENKFPGEKAILQKVQADRTRRKYWNFATRGLN